MLIDAGAPVTTLAEAAAVGRLDPRAVAQGSESERAAALRAAAVCQRLEMIDELLDAGVPAHAEIEGATALHFAGLGRGGSRRPDPASPVSRSPSATRREYLPLPWLRTDTDGH